MELCRLTADGRIREECRYSWDDGGGETHSSPWPPSSFRGNSAYSTHCPFYSCSEALFMKYAVKNCDTSARVSAHGINVVEIAVRVLMMVSGSDEGRRQS